MFIPAMTLILSLIVLVKSSEYSIKYSVRFSKLVGVSQMGIGFLLIGITTSLPELSIAILSGIAGEGMLSVGNLLGSNIIKMTLVFGITAIVTTIHLRGEMYREIIRAVAITSVITLVIILINQIDYLVGMLCLIVFALFFHDIYKKSYKIKTGTVAYSGLKTIETLKTLFYALTSIVIVIISAKLITDSAIILSDIFNISETLIGASILAIGTTLPELTISLTAIKRGNISLAIGDIFGATVINLTLVLGVLSMFGTVVLSGGAEMIVVFLLFSNMIFIFMSPSLKFGKIHGIILVSLFIVYLIIISYYEIFFI